MSANNKKSLVPQASIESADLARLPSPLASVLSRLMVETAPFRRIHRLIDAAEVFAKLHTVIIVSQFLARPDVSQGIRTMLANGLKTPSFGLWAMFMRDTAEALRVAGELPMLPGIDRCVLKGGALYDALNGNDNFVALRNSYAHGATPSDSECTKGLEQYEPRLWRLVQEATHLQDCKIVVVVAPGQAVLAQGVEPARIDAPAGLEPGCWLITDAQPSALALHPLLAWQAPPGKVFFFNDLRDEKVGILEYADCHHERLKALYPPFLQRIPIDEWRGSKADREPFRERIEALTETFKGRRKELGEVCTWLRECQSGFRMIWGPPGVGKSALLARLTQILRWSNEVRSDAYPDLPMPEARVHVVEYFLRRGEVSSRAAPMLDHLLAELNGRFGLSIKPGSNELDKAKALRTALTAVSRGGLEDDERLLLLIDGLDEGDEDPAVYSSLPKADLPDKVLVLYASRPQPMVEDRIYSCLKPEESRSSQTLTGLTLEDTRALLSEFVSKYDIQPAYVAAVLHKSEGNPQYLRLLCQELEHATVALNDVQALPAKLDEIYRLTIRRLGAAPHAVPLLQLLAAATDFLTPSMMGKLLGLPKDEVERGPLAACREVLYENPMTVTYLDFQLFHESLREHLRRHHGPEVAEWNEKLATWCADWRDERGDPKHLRGVERRYAFQFAVLHLEAQRRECLHHARTEMAEKLGRKVVALVEDAAWRKECFVAVGNALALRDAARAAMHIVIEGDPEGKEMRRVVQFVRWMHEEEFRLYSEQRQRMREEGSAGKFDDLADMARMGATPGDRAKLLLFALAERRMEHAIPPSLTEAAAKWMVTARDPVLTELWRRMVGELPVGAVS